MTIRQYYQMAELTRITLIIKSITGIALPLFFNDNPEKTVGYFQVFIKDEMSSFEKCAKLSDPSQPENQKLLIESQDISLWKMRFLQGKSTINDYPGKLRVEPTSDLLMGSSILSTSTELVITSICGGNPDTNQFLSNTAMSLILTNAGYNHSRYLENAKAQFFKKTLN